MFIKFTYVYQIYLSLSNLLMFIKFTYVYQIYLCLSNLLEKFNKKLNLYFKSYKI